LLDARLHRLGRHIVGLRIHGGGFERERANKRAVEQQAKAILSARIVGGFALRGGIELTNLGLWRAEGEEKKECAGLWGFGGKRTELSYSNVSSYPRGVGLAWLGPGCLGADDGKLTVGCQALSRG
jgi:hypothetical protein